jgi:arsenate reductase
MTDLTFYHNPRCSKSRAALELLQTKGITPRVIRYLEAPPDFDTLATLIEKLHITPRELIRKGEDEYRILSLEDTALTDEQLITAMVAHPKLIERPILVSGDNAVVGRPPERVLELLK